MKTDLKTEHICYSLSCQIQRCVGSGGPDPLEIHKSIGSLGVMDLLRELHCMHPVAYNNILAYCMIPCVPVMQKFQLIMSCTSYVSRNCFV